MMYPRAHSVKGGFLHSIKDYLSTLSHQTQFSYTPFYRLTYKNICTPNLSIYSLLSTCFCYYINTYMYSHSRMPSFMGISTLHRLVYMLNDGTPLSLPMFVHHTYSSMNHIFIAFISFYTTFYFRL